MSYTEYLRRKASGSPVVIDRRVNTDASMHTIKQRHLASRVFPVTDRIGVITNTTDVNTSPLKAVRSYTKATGKVPDASFFTSHAGAWQIIEPVGKITLQAVGGVSGCCVPVLGPAPKSASDFTRQATNCCSEPHNAGELGPALFVDNTIRLKNLLGCCGNEINKAIHTHPTPTPYASWSPRPEKGAGGIPVFTVASPSDARKVGDFTPRKIPYIEKHHGNDLFVNPRQVPQPYKPNTGIPHLKINDAFPRGCGSCQTTIVPSQCDECTGANEYELSLEAIVPNLGIGVEVSPYNEAVFPCLGDIITLQYVSDADQTIDIYFQTPVPGGSVTIQVNSDIPTVIPASGSGPYDYAVNGLALTTGETYKIVIVVDDCKFDSILFGYNVVEL